VRLLLLGRAGARPERADGSQGGLPGEGNLADGKGSGPAGTGRYGRPASFAPCFTVLAGERAVARPPSRMVPVGIAWAGSLKQAGCPTTPGAAQRKPGISPRLRPPRLPDAAAGRNRLRTVHHADA
jgi:hypothetical protein